MAESTILYIGTDDGLVAIGCDDGGSWEVKSHSLKGWSVPKLDVSPSRPNRVIAGTRGDVAWAPPAWTTAGEVGPDQQTPDISSIIQEIVNRAGWTANNSMALIITGNGKRTAEAFDANAAAAPLLHVEYLW